MSARPSFAFDAGEPLGALRQPEGAAAQRVEFSSRGDRVPGRLWWPATGSGPRPWVILEHAAAGSKDDPALDAIAGRWAERGLAVAAIDLPLHGERASPKLSRRLLAALDQSPPLPALAAALWSDFLRQSVIDLRRFVQALGSEAGLERERLAFVGLGLGAAVGAAFCAEEPRVRAAALAAGTSGIGPVAAQALDHLARVAPRPLLLLLDGSGAEATLAAFLAASRRPRGEAGQAHPDGPLLDAISRFLLRELRLEPA